MTKGLAWLALLAGLVLPGRALAGLADSVGGCLGNPPERTLTADPSSYRALLGGLGPGDRLLLAAGTYTQGLPITGLNGAAGRCIVIEGPESPRAVFIARDCCNTVAVNDSSYLVVRNLELDGQGRAVDGVKAESPSVAAHHITLENLVIRGHGADQQIVGISTKCPAWNWVIRRCTIVGAGTGVYLGNSDGSAEFVNGLVEHNLVRDSIGYDMQIKHQNIRDTGIGEPASGTTLIRHNVFSKAQGASSGPDARPNLLVGHWPLAGAGASDVYEVYGNFFHQNPVEALFQGEGNIALYDNVFLNDSDPGIAAIAIQPQNDVPKAVQVFHNTVVAAGPGIRVAGGDPGFQQQVRANAVFAGLPIEAADTLDNVEDVYGAAPSYLVNPTGPVGNGLDLYPLVGTLRGAPIDTTGLTGFPDWDRDFNGTTRDLAFRGAYSGEGTNPGWAVALDIKPEPPDARLSIGDANLGEGDAGTTTAVFVAALLTASATSVTVEYSTVDGTATAGLDYEATSGTLSFAPGVTTQTLGVAVYGDALEEANETFTVSLSNAANATLARAQGVGTILDDDASLSIGSKTIREGNGKGGRDAEFSVVLSRRSRRTVTVSFVTGGGTATPGLDYVSAAGTLTFPPLTARRKIRVRVLGDTLAEGNETFFVDLLGATGATIAVGEGVGLILDDDR